MRHFLPLYRRGPAAAMTALLLALGTAWAQDVPVMLSGDAEVPPVQTAAAGSGTLKIGADRSVSGSVATRGVAGTMAHIHLAAAGQNGGVIIPLRAAADGQWEVPPGAQLTEAQYQAFKEGKLYVNVHSAAHPGGEIRAQLMP